MKFRELFSIPAGKRITEKYLYRVLISSICSILLCMGCLAGTTWAWFAVSIENTENVIAIASHPEVVITVNGAEFASASDLDSGVHSVTVTHASEPDDVQQKSTLYVTFSLNEEVQGYVMLNLENSYTADIQINANQKCNLSWTVSWFEPDSAELVVDGLIELRDEEKTETAVETGQPTEGETEPTEATMQPTEGETEPAEETTQPTETEPTEATTQPTETETEPTEETTQPTEVETEAVEETFQSAEAEMETGETTMPTETNVIFVGDDV